MKQTMKILQRILKLTLLLMVAIFWSCTNDILFESLQLSDTPIRLEAGYDHGRTRATTEIRQHRAFDKNEQLNVYIKTHEDSRTVGRAPIVCTTSEAVNYVNALTPDYQTYYPANANIDIFALYPSTINGTLATTNVTVPDIQGESTYKDNDVMYASLNDQPRTDQTVRLQFSHKMVKLVVNVTLEEELTLEKIKLINFNRTVELTPATGVFGTLSNPGDITIENNGTALVPPQVMNGEFLAVETNMGIAKFSTTKTFEAGTEYTISLTIGRDNIGLTANITDWSQDGARQIIQQTTADGYEITYTPSLPFIETYRTNPYTQPDLVIRPTPTAEVPDPQKLKRYTTPEADYDYSVLFFGNNQAGLATMVINGNPDKESTKALAWVKTFTILQGTGSLTYPAYSEATTYDASYNYVADAKLQVPYENGGIVNWPCTKVCDPGAATFVSTNTNVASVDQNGNVVMHGVGETTIMASSPNNGNYTAASTSYNLEVTKRMASALTIVLSQTEYTYNGLPCTPGVTVYDGGVAPENLLSPGTDYTIGYSNNLNAGVATVTVTGAGDYNGTAVKNYTINPITTTFNESYDDVTMAINKTLERSATINHHYGNITYSSSNTSVATVNSNGTVTTGGNTGTATITIHVAEPTPKNYTSATMSYVVTVENYDKTYDYTGSVQTFTCKQTGTYLLEVWGASGGWDNPNFVGGNGAYVAGTVQLTQGQVLYVYVGGEGSSSTGAGAGGWNGGGSGTSKSPGGGGATDISICNGTWNSDSHLKSRIIVAGGGGGALSYNAGNFFNNGYAIGGHGGAYDGRSGSGVSSPGKGGTRSGAGSSGSGNTTSAGFGFGGNYTGSSYAGAGGGGWYGGGAGGDSGRHGAGGGGSSYLWNSSNARYYPGGSPLTTGSQVTDATKFYLTERGKSSGTNSGNGKAKITFLE